MVGEGQSTGKAVLFLDADDQIVRSLLFTEFESILDGFVRAHDWKTGTHRAVYVEVNENYSIKSMVLFRVTLNDDGQFASKWNFPLEKLIESAPTGPDLGAGPVKICHRQTCLDQRHHPFLWAPPEHALNALLENLCLAVRREGLGLEFDEFAADQSIKQELSNSIARLNHAVEAEATGAHLAALGLIQSQVMGNQTLETKSVTLDKPKAKQEKPQHLSADMVTKFQAALAHERQKNLELFEQIETLQAENSELKASCSHSDLTEETMLSPSGSLVGEEYQRLRKQVERDVIGDVSKVTNKLKNTIDHLKRSVYMKEREIKLLRSQMPEDDTAPTPREGVDAHAISAQAELLRRKAERSLRASR